MESSSEVARLRQEVQRLSQENKRLQENFDEFSLSSHELEQELEHELESCEQAKGKLLQQLRLKSDQLESLQSCFQDQQASHQTLQKQIHALTCQVRQEMAHKRECETKVDELETQIRVLEATERDLRHKLEREMENRIFVASDLEELQKEHELMQERMRTQVLDLQSELFALRHQDRSRTYSMESISMGMVSTPKASGRTVNQIQILTPSPLPSPSPMRNANKKQDEARATALEEQPATTTATDAVEAPAEDLQTQAQALLDDQRDVFESQLQMKDQLIATLQEEITQLTELSQQEMAKKEHLEQELLLVRDQVVHVENLASQIQDIYRENRSKSQQIVDSEQEICALKEFKSNLQMENTQLNKTIGDLESQAMNLQRQNNQLKERESQLQNQMEEVESLLTETLTREKLLVTQVDQLKDKKHQLQKALGQLQCEMDQLTTENEHLRQLIKQSNGSQQQKTRSEPEAEVSSSSSSSSPSSPISTSPMEVMSETESGGEMAPQAMDTNDSAHPLPAHEGTSSNRSFYPDGDFSERNSFVLSAPSLLSSYSSEQLASKLLQEKQRSALLLSRLQNVCGNLQVFCRVRPLLQQEQRSNTDVERAYGVRVLNNSDVAVLEMKPPRAMDAAHRRFSCPVGMTSPSAQHHMKWKVFTFDRVLGPQDSQMDMFREVEPMAQAVVDGFKACILAYGQTGSGKTYTMEGTASSPGINHRIIEQLFESIRLKGSMSQPRQSLNTSFSSSNHAEEDDDEVLDHGACYHVELAVMEVYNETIRDLLIDANAGSSPIDIRQQNEHGDVCVTNLTRHIVANSQETLALLEQAQQKRATGHTNVHAHSSRSHCVVMLDVRRTGSSSQSGDESMHYSSRSSSCSVSSSSSTAPSSDEHLHGKLYLVDLAGSECLKKSRAEGCSLRETGQINKSLAALGDVMEALEQKRSHVPYRNSKLTFLLQDVLQTSSKTMMIVTLSPWIENAMESLRSLQLAQRAKHIVVGRNAIRLNKKELVSGKQAYAEIQSLKHQMQVVVRKNTQLQQTLVAMKREHKEYVEKQAVAMENRVKNLESQCANYKKQNESLKRLHDEMKVALRKERDAKQSALTQNEKHLRQMRQLHANSRVNASHQANVEGLLKDRDEEVRKLRNSLLEARRRSSSGLMMPPHRASLSSTPSSKRSSSEPVAYLATSDENEDENENESNQMEVELSQPTQEDADMTTPKNTDEAPSPFRRFWNRTTRGWMNTASPAPSSTTSSSSHGVKRRTDAMDSHEDRERPQKTTFPPWK